MNQNPYLAFSPAQAADFYLRQLRRSKILLGLLCAAALGLMLAALALPAGVPGLILFCLGCLLALSAPMLVRRLCGSGLSGVTGILQEGCDPQNYLDTLHLLAAAPAMRRSSAWITLEQGAAQYYLGSAPAAETLLRQTAFPLPRMAAYELRRQNLLALCCLARDDWQGYRVCVEALERIGRLFKPQSPQAGAVSLALELVKLNAREKDGFDAGDLPRLEELLRQSGSTLQQCRLHYALGLACRAQGRTKDARTHFTFAAQHGGGTFLARQAGVQLASL